jgi:hypothetical protein
VGGLISGGIVKYGRLPKSVAGAANVTLTTDEAQNGIQRYTGVITGNIAVIVPATDGLVWLVQNATTGAFTLTVKTSAGTGIVVATARAAILFCDGVSVFRASPDVDFTV